MTDFLKFIESLLSWFPVHVEICYNKTCDWTICIYKKGCASKYPSSENNGEDAILCKVDDNDMELCFARAHVALKDWLLEYEGGY